MVYLDEVESSRLVRGLSDDQIVQLGSVGRQVDVPAGAYVFRVGDPADTLYLVRAGLVELVIPVKVLGVTTDVVVTTQSCGDTLAWSALVEPYRLTMGARAKTDVTLYGFVRAKLLTLCESAPELGYLLMRNLSVIVGRRLDFTLNMWFAELERSVSAKYR